MVASAQPWLLNPAWEGVPGTSGAKTKKKNNNGYMGRFLCPKLWFIKVQKIIQELFLFLVLYILDTLPLLETLQMGGPIQFQAQHDAKKQHPQWQTILVKHLKFACKQISYQLNSSFSEVLFHSLIYYCLYFAYIKSLLRHTFM